MALRDLDILAKSDVPGYKLRFFEGKKKAIELSVMVKQTFFHQLHNELINDFFKKGFWEARHERPHIL